MKLVNRDVEIHEIFLDPYNPRFIDQKNDTQENIMQMILNTKDAKELLNSMKINIKWVNKIVVIHKKDFSKIQKEIYGIDNAEYLIVEGNNRLACLKSNKIPGIDLNTEIPVILAGKEEGETDDDFESQIRITQGIANVMVVKEWSVISKARHLFFMYCDARKKDANKDKSPHELYKRIAEELGIGTAEVRQSIVRYEFYSKINNISDNILEDHWGYLEAFDRNKDIRSKFGMSPDNNLINLDEDDEEGYIEEILKEIPAVIKKAASEGINTKQFRDIIDVDVATIDSTDDLLEFMQYITESDGDYDFKSKLDKSDPLTEEEKWKTSLESIVNQIEMFPNLPDWSKNFLQILDNIKSLIESHITIIQNK
jgi:hypothetical protein